MTQNANKLLTNPSCDNDFHIVRVKPRAKAPGLLKSVFGKKFLDASRMLVVRSQKKRR